jgi:excisionase family DNA binding protein
VATQALEESREFHAVWKRYFAEVLNLPSLSEKGVCHSFNWVTRIGLAVACIHGGWDSRKPQSIRTDSNCYYTVMARPGVRSRVRPPPPDVMTIEQLSVYLQIAKSTLYKLAQEGKVPGQKVGKHWRFRKDAIDRWLDESPKELPR